jgi:hypothetical protein
MFHRLGLRDCPSWKRQFVPIGPWALCKFPRRQVHNVRANVGP